MLDRSQYLLKIRPDIPTTAINETMGLNERFQNETLRPVLKFQNGLLIAVFKNYITKHKNKFQELSIEKKLLYIENAIQKDIKFRNSLKGIIIGAFAEEEYAIYIQDSSALNKRMMNLVIKRLQDQIQVFEEEVLIH